MTKIHGLHDVGHFKLHEKHNNGIVDIFIGKKINNKIQRLKTTRNGLDRLTTMRTNQ